jgi:class 3 adenylate cyclase/tetratricopeptide (TPR) repeat protein
MDVPAWLRNLGLERYEQAFRENEIDAEVLPKLTAEDLTALGVTPIGHRRKLLEAIAELGAATMPAGKAAAPARPLGPDQNHHIGSVTSDGERRQLAVMFADLAGFTALGRELDAEEVHALLERFFGRVDHIVEEHGGRVDKHIGDCVMAVFGAPVAHGNDVERAVSAALTIRDAMPKLSAELGRPIRVHIGVAGGQVVASGTGSASHREYTVTGDTVNLASRLTDAAAPGEVLISETVWRALAERLDCNEVGALALEGFAEPVRAWRLRDLQPAAPAVHGNRSPFVGRRSELGQFAAALSGCRQTGRGQAVYVRGEAGIGKTRLVEEFQREAAVADFACHTGLVLDFGTGTGRDAVRAIVRSLLGVDLASDAEAARAAAERAAADGLVTADDAVFLNDLLDLPQPKDLRALYDAMDNTTRNRGKRRAVAGLVERASRTRPRLLVIEDIHWANPLQLAHLAKLTAAVAECPALLVMTSRIEGDPLDREWRSRTAGAPLITIDLGPLRREEALTLASAFSNAPDQFAERCVERAAGNPLFLEQLLRHVEESAEAGIPGSVQNLVQARLDRLDPADKTALQAASVLGQSFGRGVLRHLLDRPDYAPEHLVAHFLVRPQGEGFLFAHALIRDAVYGTLLKNHRRELHRRAAGWFSRCDPVLYAEHLDRADDPGAPRAYLAAAQAQATEYRNELARRLVERGLALAVERADRFPLACFHADILHDLGDMTAAGVAYRSALDAAESGAERCRALVGLAAVKRVADDLEGAFADLERAEAEAVEQGLITDQARIHYLRGNLFFPRGDINGCVHEHELSRELAQQAGSAELEAAALGGLGDAEYAHGRMATANRHFSRCVELCRAHSLGRTEVANLSMVPATRIYLNELRPALEDSRAAAVAATRVGHHRAEMIAHGAACVALRMLGDMSSAREHIERRAQLIQRLGARRFEAVRLRDAAGLLEAEGRQSEAVELLHRGLAISRETGIRFLGPWLLGQLAATTKDPEVRQRALDEGESVLRAGAVGHNHLWFYHFAIEAALSTRAWDSVEHYAAMLEDFTRAEPLPWSDFFIARGRALAAFGRGRRDAALSAELERLRSDADRVGLRIALPALQAALASAALGGSRDGAGLLAWPAPERDPRE